MSDAAPPALLGYVSPSTVRLPWEVQDMLPPGVGVVVTNLGVRQHTAGEFDRASQALEGALRLLVDEGARAIVIGGVPLAVRRGFRDEAAFNLDASDRLGVPVTSGTAAAVQGLRHLGVTRLLVATAYRDSINDLVATYFTDAGFSVRGMAGLSVGSPRESSALEGEVFVETVRRLAATAPDAEGVFLGARGNVLDALAQIESDPGLPAVHGQQAGLWWALRHLGVPLHAPRFGRLMA